MSLSPTADAAVIASAGTETTYFLASASTLLYADVPPRLVEAAKELVKLPNVAVLGTPSSPPPTPRSREHARPFAAFDGNEYYIHGHGLANLGGLAETRSINMDRNVVDSLEKIVSTGSGYIRSCAPSLAPFPNELRGGVEKSNFNSGCLI